MGKLLRGSIQLLSVFPALLISPIFIALGFCAAYIDRFSDVSVIIGYIPFYFGEYVRYFYYKTLLKRVGRNVVFKFGSFCQYPETKIGNNCLIGYFNTLGQIDIGDDVLCGAHVNFTSGLKHHSFSDPTVAIKKQPGKRVTITIGSDVWIGNNSVICANIGNRSVIGAGSVVVKDLESHGVYAGNPATLLRKI